MKPEALAEAWRAALDRWSTAISLALPVPIPQPHGPIAYIDLATRQTHVNFARLEAMGVGAHVPCVLAHEVGHHIRYPHTVAEARRMLRFLRELASELYVKEDGALAARDRYDWLLNLFFDLLINDELHTDYEASFVAIFRAMEGEWGATFAFYITLFEELWMLTPGAMVPEAAQAALLELDPEVRSRARSAAEFIRGHPENRPLQLVRFVLAMRPFVFADGEEKAEAFEREPLGAGGPLDPDAVSDLMKRRGDEDDARKWLREHGGGRQKAGIGGGDPLERANLELQGLVPPEEVALSTYRREADRAPLAIPASIEPGEPILPGPHEAWSIGDDLEAVDWIGSVVRAGGAPIPGISTFLRSRLADDPRPGDRETPWVELYVDSSCSMPDPKASFSHQILAGFILTRAAARAGGRVRVIQYSSQSQLIAMPEFVRAPDKAERALLEYIGGGTDFPWAELTRSIERFRRIAKVRRVVISDSDFISNARSPTPTETRVVEVLGQAARAGGITGILAVDRVHATDLAAAGMEVVPIADWSSAADAARALARALFVPRGT